MGKPVPMTTKPFDEIYTPDYAIKPLIPYIDKGLVIWENAYGTGLLAKHLRKVGYKVVGNANIDFLKEYCECDVIVTNPPYSIKEKFLQRAFELGKPFAFLLPLTTLEGQKRGKLFADKGIQLIIPNRRINFIYDNAKSASWFSTAWFTWKLKLPKDLLFVQMERLPPKEVE